MSQPGGSARSSFAARHAPDDGDGELPIDYRRISPRVAIGEEEASEWSILAPGEHERHHRPKFWRSFADTFTG